MSGGASAIEAASHSPAAKPEVPPPPTSSKDETSQHQRPLSHYDAVFAAGTHHENDEGDPDGE